PRCLEHRAAFLLRLLARIGSPFIGSLGTGLVSQAWFVWETRSLKAVYLSATGMVEKRVQYPSNRHLSLFRWRRMHTRTPASTLDSLVKRTCLSSYI
ncbi:hypothetical protein CVT26_005620, partial [Gymnopilus dilepis]